jgi:hypothetical protein
MVPQISLDMDTPLEVVEMLRGTVEAHVKANAAEFSGASAGACGWLGGWVAGCSRASGGESHEHGQAQGGGGGDRQRSYKPPKAWGAGCGPVQPSPSTQLPLRLCRRPSQTPLPPPLHPAPGRSERAGHGGPPKAGDQRLVRVQPLRGGPGALLASQVRCFLRLLCCRSPRSAIGLPLIERDAHAQMPACCFLPRGLFFLVSLLGWRAAARGGGGAGRAAAQLIRALPALPLGPGAAAGGSHAALCIHICSLLLPLAA